MKVKSCLITIIALLTTACMADLPTPVPHQNYSDGFSAMVYAPDFVSNDDTKSSIDTSNVFAWVEGDKIGLYSNKIGSLTQTQSQLAMTLSAGTGMSAAYSSTTGWALIPDSTFNYFSYYPYDETNEREKIVIDYKGQTQTENNSTAGLGAYDYLYSDMAEAISESSVFFSFHHIGALTNINITVPEEYNNATFYKMRLYADTAIFATSAGYSVGDIAATGSPSLDRHTSIAFDLSFGDSGIKPSGGVIRAWLMMAPNKWAGKNITTNLYTAKNNISVLSGSFTPSENQLAGTRYTYSVSSAATGQYLPDKPLPGEQLHILLFGHSFGLDCTDFLPAIVNAAGITDVHFGRFMDANCSLDRHWSYLSQKKPYEYYDSNPSTGKWVSTQGRTTDYVLAKDPWDIIIFQQSIGFGGEGSYSSYQPHLNYLTHYVDSVCTKLHGKTPVIGWNMFWGYNSQGLWGGLKYAEYDIDATKMYEAIVQAAKDMTADETKANDIPLIIATGTAIQNARGTSVNDLGSPENPSTTRILTRDGYHASLGIGRYVTACTWFQYLIAPMYGKTITGNTYRPTAASFPKDTVNDTRAAILWKCAIEAVNHPYEVTKIQE